MFEFLFSKKTIEQSKVPQSSEFRIADVRYIRPLKWEEHCVECAPPACYRQCIHYQHRSGGSCIRLSDGLQRDKNFRGRYPFGIRCRFRVWSKIEALVIPSTVSPFWDNIFTYMEHFVIFSLLTISKILHDYRFLTWGSCYWSKFLLRCDWIHGKIVPDYFWIEAELFEKNETQFRLQIFNGEKILYTNSLTFYPGHNIFSIPYSILSIENACGVRVFLAPDVPPGKEINIVFLWLDFVCLKKQNSLSASKVKCAVWDLDKTIYDGVLSETEKNAIRRRPRLENVIKELDNRGILNSICSKNDFNAAKELLSEWGLWQYFVAPSINWGQKSENIRQIAQHLNLGLDSFAFIDDTPQERMEVQQQLSMVRVYSENTAELFCHFPEFDVSSSGMGQQRRLSYQAEEKRTLFKEKFTEQYDDYLRGLKMVLSIIPLDSEPVNKRCYELLARSNQLNLTTRRYSADEFSNLIHSSNIISMAFSCSDIFGNYGIVGFASVQKDLEAALPVLTDLVISCRVARKKVENAIVYAIGKKLLSQGYAALSAKLIKTKKNGPLAQVFSNLPFEKIEEDDIACFYRLDLMKISNIQLVVNIDGGR